MPDLRADTTAPRVAPDAAWLASLPWLKEQMAPPTPIWQGARVDARPEAEPDPVSIEADYNPDDYVAHDEAQESAAEVVNNKPSTVSSEVPEIPDAEVNNFPSTGSFEAPRARYVKTDVAEQMVKGREAEVVRGVGIAWHGRDHIHCPYGTHPDRNPSWRLTEQGLAICTCRTAHNVFQVVMAMEGIDFDAAKLRVVEILGRQDLIIEPDASKGCTLAQIAEAKGLPIEFLHDTMGWRDEPRYGKFHKPAVRMPYLDGQGGQWDRFRVSLGGNKEKRFFWRRGDKGATLYGAWQIATMLPEQYVVLLEGETDVATCWHNDFSALGIAGAPGGWNEARHAVLLEGFPIIIVIIEPGGAGEQLLARLARSSIAPRLRVARMPVETKDPSALYLKDPENFVENFRAVLKAAEPFQAKREENKAGDDGKTLLIGSDVEIAYGVAKDLINESGKPVFDDGWIHRYDGKRWVRITEVEERRAVHCYDGTYYKTAADGDAIIQLYKSKIDSILNEARVVMAQPGFFKGAPTGINCASGFIRFDDDDGQPRLIDHDRDHGCRHVLPGSWSPDMPAEPRPDSMLYRLIYGPMFDGDADADKKIDLVAELLGATALGYATKLAHPKAVILQGVTADNGKSQILDLCRGLLPEDAITSIPPNKFSEPAYLVKLAGKLFNGADELKGSAAIASDVFKAAVTGQFITARDLYRSKIDFRPIALHLFATQTLPSFEGGFDRGVLRRLLVLVFTRVIPQEGRIIDIGRRIAAEEADLLLAFAVGGATRLIRQKEFTVPPSSEKALQRWATTADPVLAWIAARVEHAEHPMKGEGLVGRGVKGPHAHQQFRTWAIGEGYRHEQVPAIGNFLQPLQGNKIVPDIRLRHANSGNWLTGMKIHQIDADPSEDVNDE
jgi:phage/plasmid-associated DNA primase